MANVVELIAQLSKILTKKRSREVAVALLAIVSLSLSILHYFDHVSNDNIHAAGQPPSQVVIQNNNNLPPTNEQNPAIAARNEKLRQTIVYKFKKIIINFYNRSDPTTNPVEKQKSPERQDSTPGLDDPKHNTREQIQIAPLELGR